MHNQGYELFVQGDCDGNLRDIFEQLVRQGIVEPENTFAFDVDFESSFPPAPIYNALCESGALEGVSFEEFDAAMATKPVTQSVLDAANEKWGVEVQKVELAETLGELTNDYLYRGLEDSFWSEMEIGRFLAKIMRLP